MIEKRKPVFIENLSMVLLIVSSMGAILVLLDPIITFTTQSGTIIKIGGTGFSDQLKGAIVMLMLVGGFTAVVNYWIGASNQGVKAQDSVNTIAQASAPAAAAAVAAATGAVIPPIEPIRTDDVKIDAAGANISIDGTPATESGK